MRKIIGFIIIICFVFSVASCSKKSSKSYPIAKKGNIIDDYHGTKVADYYRWMEDLNSPDTIKWVEAEKKVTGDYFARIPFREKLKQRLAELWDYKTISTPEIHGDYIVFERNDGLQEQDVVYVQKGFHGVSKVLLDPNTFSNDGSVSLASFEFSEDFKYMGYGISRGGSDWREFFVMETATRKVLPDHVKWVKFAGISWYKDGFFYSRYDEPVDAEKYKAKMEFQKVYYHKVGTTQSEDSLIHQDQTNPRLGFDPQVTVDGKFLIIDSWQGSSNNNFIYYKDLEKDGPVIPLIKESMGKFQFLTMLDGRFILSTDYQASNFRVVVIDPQNNSPEEWQTIIPARADKLEWINFAGGRLIANYLKDASSVVVVFDTSGKELHRVQLPGIGSVRGFTGKAEEKEVFYRYSSFTVPETHYIYDIENNQSQLFNEPQVIFDQSQFESNRVFYQSKDKTRVPLFLVHKKGLIKDGSNPTLLYAYGGFNSSRSPGFSAHLIPFLENGGIYAMACIRGGGEYGEKWHRAGMLESKQNVFDDFIAAGKYMVAEGYTSPGKLAIRGGSNGGLLVGAVINQEPELFKVAIPQVGVMDMLRFHKFTIGWAWTGEYGSSENPFQFKYIYAYSPLHNIREGLNYPATLVTTSDRDDRVFPAHSFKYIAELQDKYKGQNPVLIRIESKAGHGGASGTSRRIALYADIYSFIFYNMGIEPQFPTQGAAEL